MTAKNKQNLSKYIENMRRSLKAPGAHALYFPPSAKARKVGSLRLAREIGFGLRGFPEDILTDVLGTLYGKLIVENCLDTTGVQVNNKEWLAEMRRIIDADRAVAHVGGGRVQVVDVLED